MKKRLSNMFIFVVMLILILSLSSYRNVTSAYAQQPNIPDGFSLKIPARSGVELYWKEYAGGKPDFVQVVNLEQGAMVKLFHGAIKNDDPRTGHGFYGGANPEFYRQTVQDAWNGFSSSDNNAFCITNGQFFADTHADGTDIDPTSLAFPVKIDGQVVSEGYGRTNGETGSELFSGKKLMLEIWPGKADIVPLLSRDDLYNSDAPNIIAGLTVGTYPVGSTGRTFVGVVDKDNDNTYETILVFNSGFASQTEAASALTAFGAQADKVMMLDGGGSTQLRCGEELYVHSSDDRKIPQTLAVSSASSGVSSSVDVFMLVDLSGSFYDDLPIFKSQAPQIISSLKSINPDIRFGLGSFEDYPIWPFGDASSGDVAYRRNIDLTSDTVAVEAVINGLFTRYGTDLPQSQLPALYQAATGAGQDLSGVGYPGASIPAGQQANFRDGAKKIFLLWTDASFHNPGDFGAIPYPGPSFDTTVNAIKALDPPMVIGISSGGGGYSDLAAIASATDALAPAGGVDCDGNGTVDIQEGEPLVCNISYSGEGVGEAIVALVGAAGGVTNMPPSLTVPADQTVQYSDSLSFDVSATDPNDASNILTFSATSLPNDLILTDNGNGTATVSGIANVAPGTYTAQITVTDPGGLSDTKPVNIVVTQEDARTTYTGPLMVSTGCATCSTATIPLRATIQDITAVLDDPAYDPDAGNITNATVSFINRSNNAVLCSSNVILLDSANAKVGTATCNWTANIGSNYGMDYAVGVVVDGYYTRNSTEDDAIVVVSKPASNFITGGGFFINQTSGGTYAGDSGLKTNFGLNIKFTQKLTNLQGRVTIIVRQGDHVYQIKSTALNSLVAIPFSPSNSKSGTAELIGKATVTDVTNPLNPIALAGNATLDIVMKDNGEPGSADLIGISLWDKNGKLLFSSNWSSTKTIQQLLNEGNLSIK